MLKNLSILSAILSAFLVSISATEPPMAFPKEGLVPDAETATKIAEAVLFRRYEQALILGQRPYSISLEKGVWSIAGTMDESTKEGWVGGTFHIRIAQKDAQVLYLIHYQ